MQDEAYDNDLDNNDADDSSDEPWYEEVGAESWCREAAWCEDLEQSWVRGNGGNSSLPPSSHTADKLSSAAVKMGSSGGGKCAVARNFNYDVIVDFVKQGEMIFIIY